MKTYIKAGLLGCAGLSTLLFTAQAYAQDATIKIGGRLNADYTIADFGDENINASQVRRARIFASGTFGSNIKYKMEFNKSSGDAINLEDAYLDFSFNDSPFKIRVGQDNTHNSLDEITSSRFSSTIERAGFTDAFGFDRRLGVSVMTSGDNYTFDVGAHTTNLEADNTDDEGYALSARGTFAPVKTDETIVHLGASWRYREKGDGDSDLRYRQRPYTPVAQSRIIDTGRFAKSDNFFGGEAAVIHNQFWASGEYGVMGANGSDGNPDADFAAFYAEAGAFFGGRKVYKGGKFNRPVVDNPLGEGGYGAVSVVARYDSLDLQDDVILGEMDTVVLGVDWWPTKQTRLSLNYFNVDAENGTAEDANGVLGRLYFDF